MFNRDDLMNYILMSIQYNGIRILNNIYFTKYQNYSMIDFVDVEWENRKEHAWQFSEMSLYLEGINNE